MAQRPRTRPVRLDTAAEILALDARVARIEAERYYAPDPAPPRATAEDIVALARMSAEEIRIIRCMGLAPSTYVAKRDAVKP